MTPHADDCRRFFNRLDPGCARCVELADGAPPRKGRGVSRKRQAYAQFYRELKAHNCKTSKCGPVCTFGDW